MYSHILVFATFTRLENPDEKWGHAKILRKTEVTDQ